MCTLVYIRVHAIIGYITFQRHCTLMCNFIGCSLLYMQYVSLLVTQIHTEHRLWLVTYIIVLYKYKVVSHYISFHFVHSWRRPTWLKHPAISCHLIWYWYTIAHSQFAYIEEHSRASTTLISLLHVCGTVKANYWNILEGAYVGVFQRRIFDFILLHVALVTGFVSHNTQGYHITWVKSGAQEKLTCKC